MSGQSWSTSAQAWCQSRAKLGRVRPIRARLGANWTSSTHHLANFGGKLNFENIGHTSADFGPKSADGGPSLAESSPKLDDSGPMLVDSGPKVVEVVQTLEDSGSTRSKFGPDWFGRTWPNLVRTSSEGRLASIGIWVDLADFGGRIRAACWGHERRPHWALGGRRLRNLDLQLVDGGLHLGKLFAL